MYKILSKAVMMLAVASSASVESAVTDSWNLSRDMMNGITTNPFGVGNVWMAMYDAVGTSHNPANYQAMPTYDPNYMGYLWAVWKNISQYALLVGVATQTFIFSNGTSYFTVIQGTPTLHPGPNLSSIIRWQSPINGNINIMGRIADLDFACGNGIEWFVDKGNFTLMSGTLVNNGATILQQNIPVSQGTDLYFIVSSKNNNGCDTTSLEVDIECKGKCTDDSQLVDLISFNAIPLSNGRVSLEWETSSEKDTVGFNIWRSQSENDSLTNITRINEQLIPSRSILEWSGISYPAEEDTTVVDGNTYYYVLEDIDNTGRNTLHCDHISLVRVGISDKGTDVTESERVKHICEKYAEEQDK